MILESPQEWNSPQFFPHYKLGSCVCNGMLTLPHAHLISQVCESVFNKQHIMPAFPTLIHQEVQPQAAWLLGLIGSSEQRELHKSSAYKACHLLITTNDVTSIDPLLWAMDDYTILDPCLEACERELTYRLLWTCEPDILCCVCIGLIVEDTGLFPLYGAGHITPLFRLQHWLSLHSLWDFGSCHFESSKPNFNLNPNYNIHVDHYDDIYMFFSGYHFINCSFC